MSILILNQPQVTTGLDTMTYTIPAGIASAIYSVLVQSTEVVPSGMVCTVNKNASPVFTSLVISPTQGAFQFKTVVTGTAADAFSIVLSSASASDSLINANKTTITFSQGA